MSSAQKAPNLTTTAGASMADNQKTAPASWRGRVRLTLGMMINLSAGVLSKRDAIGLG